MAGGAATGDVLKKLKDLELENKDLKKGEFFFISKELY